MAPEGKPEDLAPTQTPAPRPFGQSGEPDIPVLKEKENERRGAGVPGYVGSSGGSGGFAGSFGAGGVRMGSSLVTQPGFLGSGRIAAALSKALGGQSSLLGGVFASKFGSTLVLGGMVAWGGLMAAAGMKALNRMSGPRLGGTQATSSAMLGSPTGSGIVIDAPKDRSLGYLAQANEGELTWDQENPNAPKPVKQAEPQADAPAEVPSAPEVPKFQMPDVSQLEAQLDRDKFVKKMTNDASSLHGGGGLKDGAAGFNMTKSLTNKTFTPRKMTNGQATRLGRIKNKLNRNVMSTQRGSSSRAMGQLKLTRNMSVSGAQMSKDANARQMQTDSFEQGRSIGGELNAIEGGGVVVPPGAGLGYTPNDINPPPVGPSGNVTPYQSQVDQAKAMDNNSAMLKMLGMMMIAMGMALMAIGRALMGNHTTFPIGAALMGAGLAMVLMGIMLLAMSASMAKQAQGQGDVIDEGYGQQDQGQVINSCADQATNSGTKADNCASPKRPEHWGERMDNSITEDVAGQRDTRYGGIGDSGGVGIESGGPDRVGGNWNGGGTGSNTEGNLGN